jgi:hypothetical protein
MLSELVGALKPILATMLLGSAAIAVVAPAFDMANSQRASESRAMQGPDAEPQHDQEDPDAEPMPEFDTLLGECLDTRDPDSDSCAAAALRSGMTYEEFRAKIVAKLEPEVTKPEPKEEVKVEPKQEPKVEPAPVKKPEPVVVKKTEPVQNEFNVLYTKCLESRDANSDSCIRAGEKSGMSAEDWAAKLRSKFAAAQQSDFATWFEKCLATRDINSDECYRAEELSGLSFGDFEAKFNSKLAAKEGDFNYWFEKCLASRDVFGEHCGKAQALIGYSDADFQAKFDRYLAERDRTTKATPKPTTKSYLTTAVMDDCGKTHLRTSDACIKALALSGMKPADFWAKMTAKYGPFN